MLPLSHGVALLRQSSKLLVGGARIEAVIRQPRGPCPVHLNVRGSTPEHRVAPEHSCACSEQVGVSNFLVMQLGVSTLAGEH